MSDRLDPWFAAPAYSNPSAVSKLGLLAGKLIIVVCYFPLGTWYIHAIIHGSDCQLIKAGYSWLMFLITVSLINQPFILVNNNSLHKLGTRLRTFTCGSTPTLRSSYRFYFSYLGLLFGLICFGVIYLFEYVVKVFVQILAALLMPFGDYAPEFPPISYWISLSLLILLIWFVLEVRSARSHIRRLRALPVISEVTTLNLGHPFKADGSPINVAHWSDLHLTEDGGKARLVGSKEVGGNATLSRLLTVHKTSLSNDVDVILVTGDITDSGHAEEWREFFKIVPDELLQKTVLVPGNHELNIPEPTNWLSTYYGADDPRRLVRTARYILALDQIQGDRTYILKNPNNPGRVYKGILLSPDCEIITLREYLQSNWSKLEEFVQGRSNFTSKNKDYLVYGVKKDAEVGHPIARIFQEIFPMVVEIPGTELIVCVMNSNAFSSNLITNALGNVDDVQLQRLRRLLVKFVNRPWVFAMHHHVGVPVLNKLSNRKGLLKTAAAQMAERSLAIDNGSSVVSAITGLIDRHQVLFNGHRHVSYVAAITNKLQVIAAPSTTLGDESGRFEEPGFGLYSVVWRKDSGTFVRSEQWYGKSGVTTMI